MGSSERKHCHAEKLSYVPSRSSASLFVSENLTRLHLHGCVCQRPLLLLYPLPSQSMEFYFGGEKGLCQPGDLFLTRLPHSRSPARENSVSEREKLEPF